MSAIRARDQAELRRLDDDDLEPYLRLREASFGYPPGDEVRRTLTGRLPITWGAFLGGNLAASLADPRFDTFVAGRSAPLAGIAAVQTLPEHRRAGLAARLMRVALEAARDDGVGWSALYPFDPRFYSRYGWQGLPTGVRLEIPVESLPHRPAPDRFERVDGDLREALQALRLRCVRSWSFSNARTRGPWDVWSSLLPEPGKRGLAYRSEHAYAVVKQEYDEATEGTKLIVIDAAFAGSRGRDDLLGILAAFRGQPHVAVLDLPADDPLVWDWASWYPARRRTTYMARVLDVPAALATARAVRVRDVGADEHLDLPPFTCRVLDDFVPWNEGCYLVTPMPDGCRAERTAVTDADCTLDVRALPLLLSGAASAEAVLRAGLAEGASGALAALASVSGGVTPFVAPEDGF